MSTLNDPAKFFKAASVFAGMLVPGHILFGFQKVYKSRGLLSKSQAAGGANADQRQGLNIAMLAWDNWNFAGVAMALLNWYWARRSPQSTEEIATLFSLAIGNIITGLRYAALGEVAPAGLLTAAGATSIAGYYFS